MDFFPFLEWLDPQGLVKDWKVFGKGYGKFFERILERHKEVRKLNSGSEIENNDNEGRSRNIVDILLDVQGEGGDT